MTTTDHTPQTVAELALASAYDGAVTALDLLAQAVSKVDVGSGSEESRKGAEAMRKFILGEVRKLAVGFRGGAQGLRPPC